jgi:hypothetical protein
MPSGRDSFRRNRVAPFVLFLFYHVWRELSAARFQVLILSLRTGRFVYLFNLMRELQCAGAEIHIVSFCSSPFTRTFFAVNLSSLRIERR